MVHYAVYYSTKDSGRVKNYAGEDKVDYICHALNDIGEKVIILSNAKTTRRKYAKREKTLLFGATELLFFSSFPNLNILTHAIDVVWGYIQLTLYVLIHVKHSDTVLVYHSMGYRGLWRFLRLIKRFNYILEVEELFQTFEANTSGYKKHEQTVFKYPDAFLFSNSFLEKEINIHSKPSAIINGIYKPNDIEHTRRNRKIDEIRVIYAGSLERQKGVDYVINAADQLPNNYIMHIIGFGDKEDIKRVNDLINNSRGKVSYDGVFKGEEYTKILQSCDIGVCIQDENDEFNKYEYPSKIFSYFSNGLQVVANDLVQLRESVVFPYLHIAQTKKPEDVAEAIISCKDSAINAQEILRRLDLQFKKQIVKLIRR